MALDKQKILNDLGNVMNQLQSADCGCMGKLFSSPGQVQGIGIGGQGCGNHCWRNQSHGHPCSGEPYSMNQQAAPMHGRPCMGHCNAPGLYTDTYSYLNQNLMQPVVKEVYEDLKGICPGNAIMNDPLGAQLGLAQNIKSPTVRGNMGQVVGQSPMGDVMGGQNAMPGPLPTGNPMNTMGGQQEQNPMGGMGAQIVNMMMKSNKSQPMNTAGQGIQQPSQGGAMNHHMAHMGANQGLNSGHMGGMGQSQSMEGMDPNAAQYNAKNMGADQDQYNALNMPIISPDQFSTGNMGANQNQYYTGMSNMGHAGMGNAVPENQNTVQHMNQQNAYTVGSAQGNEMPNMAGNMNPSQQMGSMQGRQGGQQMPTQRGNYGQHAQGVAKFNEMFPGVMQGLGGDLDFDPMAIAIQMNPANKQQATMDAMKNMMAGKGGANRQLDANAAAMKPVMNGINAVAENLNQNQVQPGQETHNQQQYNTGMASNQPIPMQQKIVNTAITDPRMSQQMPHQQMALQQVPQQQVPQQQILQQQVFQSQAIDQNYQEQLPPQPRTKGAINLPNGGYPNQVPATPQQMIKEPIYPVDTSKPAVGGQNYQYNTLGQPIEALPASTFHIKEPGLPQTLSPQPTSQQPQKYSNVKSTISKTSLFANKTGGRTPSRAQMQQVYNQYKGSQSYTNQNIQNFRAPAHQGRQQHTASEGHLNVNQPNLPRLQVPVEKVGGDTIANNQVPVAQVKGSNNIGQLGDVAANKPQSDADQAATPLKNGNLRNGLQDMVFTSYPQSAAWSFHGYPTISPYASMFRNRAQRL